MLWLKEHRKINRHYHSVDTNEKCSKSDMNKSCARVYFNVEKNRN